MNVIIRILPPTAKASLESLMCRKHKGEEVATLVLHPWNEYETRLQVAGGGISASRDKEAA